MKSEIPERLEATITVKLRLITTPEQEGVLKNTLMAENAACNWIAQRAYESNVFQHFSLYSLLYRECRMRFPKLSADTVNRAINKTASAYASSGGAVPHFKPLGAFPHDKRTATLNAALLRVSLWSIAGRLKLDCVCGTHQAKQLSSYKLGMSQLKLINGSFYLLVNTTVQTQAPSRVSEWIGIDLGLANLARGSDGQTFGNARLVSGIRSRRWRQRKRLQSKGTRSSRRVLKRLRGRESRFVRDVNHQISKQICAVAKRTGRGVALEDLRGIRGRIRAIKKQRRVLHSWAFADLQSKIEYKCRLSGVPVKFIDPRNTSRKCPACGHIAKANRKTRDLFACVQCGFTADADTNGAENIRLAATNQPNERDGNRAQVQSQIDTSVELGKHDERKVAVPPLRRCHQCGGWHGGQSSLCYQCSLSLSTKQSGRKG